VNERRSLPMHGYLGLGLIAVSWPANWLLAGLRTHLWFFPLWLGFILVVDALTVRRVGSSIMTRSPRGWLGLFVVSAPAWWLFEAINLRTGNWEYLGRDEFSAIGYALMATVAFSTVIPAVFGAAELVRSYAWVDRFAAVRPLPEGRFGPIAQAAAGATMLALLLVWPRECFPLVWVSLWLLLEPLNDRLGARTLIGPLRRGDARPLVALATGALLCGVFWEMWNFASFPKWIYHIPYVGFGKVFEMPVLGYGGYVPFAWELFALYQLVARVFGLDASMPRLDDA
jgi:hypothetical protein